MPKQTAIKLQVEIGPDRTVRLPEEVPAGRAELIVLVPDRGITNEPETPSPIGLFQNEPALMDQLMEYVQAIRSESQMKMMPLRVDAFMGS